MAKYLCIFILCVMGLGRVYACSDHPEQDLCDQQCFGKIYVKEHQVKITDGKMYIEFDGEPCRVSEILEDEKGIYVNSVSFWWVCRNGHPNPPWRIICMVCNQT